MKPYVVYSTNELLSATYKDVLPAFQESNVIYQFSCHCDSRYVGRISLRLQDRIKKHVPKSIRSSSSSQKRLLPACHGKSSIQSLASDSAIELIFYKILTVLSIMIRVTIFFRQSTGTVVVLRDFSGDLQKKKSLHSGDPCVFAIFKCLHKQTKNRDMAQRPPKRIRVQLKDCALTRWEFASKPTERPPHS